MEDPERTAVWRRPAAADSGLAPRPDETAVDGRRREPVRAGDTSVNVNQPQTASYTTAVAPTVTQLAVWRAQRIVYYIFGVIEAFIAIRFVLKLLAANPASPFTQIVYAVSWVFVFPFSGVVPNFVSGGSVFEWFSLIAVLIYALLSIAIVKLIGLIV